MKCINCGAELPDGAQFCSECDMKQPIVNQVREVQNDLTLQQYYSQITDASEKKWVNLFSVICILTAVFSGYLAIAGGITLAIVDVIVYFAGGILVGFRKNWKVCLCVAAYALLATLLVLAQGGRVIGILDLIAGIKATITLAGVEKAYKNYIKK